MIRRLEISRAQILSFRRSTGHLDERLPTGAESLRKAAWAGFQDSVPRSALLSIHARVEDAAPDAWAHHSLLQLWGPRFTVYVVAAKDLAVFTLGRMPVDAKRQARAENTAERLNAFLKGASMPFGRAGRGMGVVPNSLRYAAATGTVLMRWDGARQPDVWTARPPRMQTEKARMELARRYLHVCGPATAASFAKWAGISMATAREVFKDLAAEFTPVRTPVGDSWILTKDEAALRARPAAAAPARLLPSGDAFYLAWGADRDILVPNPMRRQELWTTRVWPGAVLLSGEIAGVWRRSKSQVTIETWRQLSFAEREAVEAEAASLPLSVAPISVRWS